MNASNQNMPVVLFPPGLQIEPSAIPLLAQAFEGSGRIVVERAFSSGKSGAHVLLVSPGSGKAPVVVKLTHPAYLEQEYEAYEAYVQGAAPQVTAHIQDKPLISDDGQLGLICYTFAGGDPTRTHNSLRDYFDTHGAEATVQVWNRIFRIHGRNWWARNLPEKFVLGEQYDRLLSSHLQLKATTDVGAQAQELVAGQTSIVTLQKIETGQLVRLTEFTIAKVYPERLRLMLSCPPPRGEAAGELRIRVHFDKPVSYQPGEEFPALSAIVTGTRTTTLIDIAQSISADFDPKDKYLPPEFAPTFEAGSSLDGLRLRNPLYDLNELLAEVVEINMSTVHGDLHLHNILVDAATGFAWLIDFGETREGPSLLDLQALEVQIITRLVAPALENTGLEPETIVDLLVLLHKDPPSPTIVHSTLQEPYTALMGIRELARQYLMDDKKWDEYYQGLVIALLGVLKYKQLGVLAQLLTWLAAATARTLIGQPQIEPPTGSKEISSILPRPVLGKADYAPFLVGPPITRPHQFFGRVRELRRLFNLWRRLPLQNAAIIGPRRSGKTSLLHYLQRITLAPPDQLRRGQHQNWLSQPKRYQWIFVDFHDIRMGTQSGLLSHLLSELSLPPSEPCTLDYFMETVSLHLNRPTIVLMDEMDAALMRYTELDDMFWEGLRSLATNHVDGNLAFVLTSQQSPMELTDMSQHSSPFFNIFGYTATLDALTEDEARELIASSPIPFAPADVEWILEKSQFWPIMLQILCRERLLTIEDAETDDTWKKDGINQCKPFEHLLI